MGKGKINGLLVLFSGIGALIGFGLGELLLAVLGGSMPAPLLIGLYFGQLGMFIGIMCLLAEMISPQLNGLNWRNQYVRSAWLYLIPATLLMISIGGAAFQLIYQVDKKVGKPNDFMMVMDISGSMASTDENNDRLNAATDFIDNMEKDQRIGILAFDHESYMVQPMVNIDGPGVKEDVKTKVMELGEPQGGTEIGGALQTAIEHINESKEKGRKAMVILLSDGYSYVDLNQTLLQAVFIYCREWEYNKSVEHKRLDPDKIYDAYDEFQKELKLLYPAFPVTHCFVDNEAQVIENGLRAFSKKKGYYTQVADCNKVEFTDRTLSYNYLFNTDKYMIVSSMCPNIIESLSTMVYADDNEDKLLDDYTTDVDTYDADFYSWSRYIDYFYMKAQYKK